MVKLTLKNPKLTPKSKIYKLIKLIATNFWLFLRLREIVKLTKVNKDLKIMISLKMIINNDQMLAIFESQKAYENLIQSILEIVQIYNLNGIDFWIDYNETRNEQPEDSLILKEIPIAIVEVSKISDSQWQALFQNTFITLHYQFKRIELIDKHNSFAAFKLTGDQNLVKR